MGISQPTTNLAMSPRSREAKRTCPPCGGPLMLLASPGSLRRFCSPACRQAAYRRRRAGAAEDAPLQRVGGRDRSLRPKGRRANA
jgi:hypothetical protein